MNGRTYSSDEVAQLARASWRQVDYWDRSGRLGPPRGRGSGERRRFGFPELVMVRAFVLAQRVAPGAAFHHRGSQLLDEVTAAWARDPSFAGVRLIVEAKRAYVGIGTRAPAALVINLASCARYVSRRDDREDAA